MTDPTAGFAKILRNGGVPSGASLGTLIVHYWAGEIRHAQGGGTVRWDRLQQAYVFVDPPPGYHPGDLMPEEWGIQ